LFDELVELGFTGSYPSLTLAFRTMGLRPHCEPCQSVKGRDVAVIDHPARVKTPVLQRATASAVFRITDVLAGD
jgi:hypothetical protein